MIAEKLVVCSRRLNAQLEAKTGTLVEEADQVLVRRMN